MFTINVCLFLLFATRAMSMLNGAPKASYVNDIFAIKHIKDNLVLKSCLGAELSRYWLLSSALCLHSDISDNIIVEARINEEKILRYTDTEVKIHPDYDKNTGKHDIGVLHIKGGKHIADEMSQVFIIPFAHYPEMNGSASAWNVKSLNGYLQPLESVEAGHLNVTILRMSECKLQFPELDCQAHLDGDFQICVFPMVEGSDLCEQDSGAPLFSFHKYNNNKWGMVGLYNDVFTATTGSSHICDHEHRHPLIFTQIFPYFDWLSRVTNIPYEAIKGNTLIVENYN